MYKNLNKNNINQYFIDITYNIIKSVYKPYKLLIINGFDIQEEQTKLCSLVALKYEDEQSIIYTMKYLHDIFNFNPSVINADYSLSLNNALSKNNLFDKKPIIINCFFHYTQALFRKMKKLNFFNKLNKQGFIIAKNIEIMSFIKPQLVPKYLLFLKDILKETNNEKLLINYIEKYWINYRGINSFNYYDYIENVKNDNSLKYLFITNNIAESFHGKIENYLPKGITTKKGFLLCMNKILKNLELKKNEIKRHDYKTKVLIYIAKKINGGDKFKWYSYNDFKNIEFDIIKNSEKFKDNNKINSIIEILNSEISDREVGNINDQTFNDGEDVLPNNNFEKFEYNSEDDVEFLDEINQNKNYINSNISNINALEKELQGKQFLNAFDEINSDLLVDNVDINEEKDELNINILKDNNFKENTKKKLIIQKQKSEIIMNV